MGESIHSKDQHALQGPQPGTIDSPAEEQDTVKRSNQLSSEKRIISPKEGPQSGASRSPAEVQEALARLRQLSFETSVISPKEGRQSGVSHSPAEVQKAIARLHQLSLETRINSPEESYLLAAGSFSSQSNFDRAGKSLTTMGLADKNRVVDVGTKGSHTVALVETQKPRPVSAITSHAKDEHIPRKEYERLEQEVKLLKAQMQSLLGLKKDTFSENDSKSAAASIPQDSSESLQTNQPVVVASQTESALAARDEDYHVEDKSGLAEGSRQMEAEESRRELDEFLRNRKVLFKPGELSLEFNLGYSQNRSDNAFDFNSQGNIGVTPKSNTRTVDTGLLLRYGLANDLEFDIAVPYGFIEQEDEFGASSTQNAVLVDNAGIGDITGALRYTAWKETGIIPAITLSLNAKSTTGDEEKRLGTGFWNVGGGISLVKTIDPVVFFGSLGYTETLEDNGVDPGSQVSYSLGTGFSMNDRVSFSTSLVGVAVTRSEINGREVRGSAQELQTLQFSSTIQLKKRLFLEPFVGFGLTKEATDFLVGFNVPFRFDRRFPLPYFHD